MVLGHAPPQFLSTLNLMMFTGLGPGDALSWPKEALQDGAIRTRRAKTGTRVYWPVIRQFLKILDAIPTHEAPPLLTTKLGRSWTVDNYHASWNTFRIVLERRGLIEPGITLYGLRHTVARHYSWRADITQKMSHIASVFEGEIERRQQKVSNCNAQEHLALRAYPGSSGIERYLAEFWRLHWHFLRTAAQLHLARNHRKACCAVCAI